MAYPSGFLDELRARVSLAEIVGRRVTLQKRGREFTGLCPFHKEKTPSFHIVEEKGFYHCLAGETDVITADGIVPIAELSGKTATILTRGGKWQDAAFRSYGRQRLYRIELSRNGVRKIVHATSGHRWFVRDRVSAAVTTELKPGHRLESVWPARRAQWKLDPAGVRHGIVFGDGTLQNKGAAAYGTVNLHGAKVDDLADWFAVYKPSAKTRGCGQDYLRAYGGRDFEHMKCLPAPTADDGYLLGFLAGYLATDGHVAKDGTVMLNSADERALERVRVVASRLGIGTFSVTKQERKGYGDTESPIFRIHFVNASLDSSIFLRSEARARFENAAKRFGRLRWVVRSVAETDRVEEVYCAEVEGEHAFALADNILTGNCFGCGAHGDVIGFAMQTQNLGFREAVEELARVAGLEVPRETPQEREREQRRATLAGAMTAAAQFFAASLAGPLGGAARAYLDGRGLDAEAIRRFGLGFAPDSRDALKRALGKQFPEPLLAEAGLVRKAEDRPDSYDYFRNRIIFPIADRRGQTIAFGGRVMGDGQPKYLNSPDTPLFQKGRVLYGWPAARAAAARDPSAIVTEGYMDVIALHRAGFGTAVAPLGTALTEHQLEEVWKLAAEPVLCFDGDAAGQRAAGRALERALPLLKAGRSLRFAVLPEGDDPDTLIRRAGAEAMREVLARAQALVEKLWETETAQPTDTPERRAALEARLEARVRHIADRTVQDHYRRFFKERLYQAFRGRRPDWQKARRGAAKRPPPAIREASPRIDPALLRRRNGEIRLALLMNYPFLLDEHVEDIANTRFPDRDLDRLLREILRIHALKPDLDAGTLKFHLTENGFGTVVNRVLSPQVLNHAASARSQADPELVREAWSELARQIEQIGEARDMAAAERDLATDMSAETWTRHRPLFERKQRG
jgi:DNA primase catalytic core